MLKGRCVYLCGGGVVSPKRGIKYDRTVFLLRLSTIYLTDYLESHSLAATISSRHRLFHELGCQRQQAAGRGASSFGSSASAALHVHLEGHLAGLHDGGLLARVARDLALRGLLVEKLCNNEVKGISGEWETGMHTLLASAIAVPMKALWLLPCCRRS